MMTQRLLSLLVTASLVALAACSAPDPSPGPETRASVPAADVGASAVVAEVDGEAITRAELDEEAAAPLARLRQEEYDVRRQVLEALIADRLVEAAARDQGISTEELLQQNVEQGVPSPPPAQLEDIYARNEARFAGQTREQAYARIVELLRQRMVAERRREFEQSLREESEVTIFLDPPRVAIDIPDGAVGTGPENAPVTIVEFTDYQCPYCHRAQDVIDQVLDQYEGQVRLVHLDFPLENHPGAVPAARAARCAAEQGRFWDYHRSLMKDKGSLDEDDLARRAATLKLDTGDFAECLASDRHLETIQAEFQQGSDLGVTGTPAYFVNGRMISGARPLSAFTEIIDAELAGD
jgi:predicted DsbA family dithiol-disulfide isomerase